MATLEVADATTSKEALERPSRGIVEHPSPCQQRKCQLDKAALQRRRHHLPSAPVKKASCIRLPLSSLFCGSLTAIGEVGGRREPKYEGFGALWPPDGRPGYMTRDLSAP